MTAAPDPAADRVLPDGASSEGLADRAHRARALDPQGSFIVQAPAGSGKTGLLIQRVLALLARVDEPEEILAITFTRKAASEMRKRIGDALERAAHEPPPLTDAHARRTWELARAALDRDRERGWELAAQPHRIAARTIDSFCESVVRAHAHAHATGTDGLGWGEVTDDAGALHDEAARRALRAPVAEPVLWHLDNELAALRRLLGDMAARRDHWARHLDGARLVGLRARLEDNLAREIGSVLKAVADAAPACLRTQAPSLVAYAQAQLGQPDPLGGRFPEASAEDLAGWRAVATLCLIDKGVLRAPGGITARVGFPSPKSVEDPARAMAEKQRMLTLLADLAAPGCNTFLMRLAQVPQLPPARYSDAQWQTVADLAALLDRLRADLAGVFRARRRVDHAEVAATAERWLAAGHAPQSVRHLLVDEFQDTARGQVRLLEHLTAHWRSGDGRTLFLVGDPMQSIYRFREAEVGLFLQVRRSGLGRLRLEPLTLAVNFRSARAVVAECNQVFAASLPADEDAETGAVPYVPCAARPDAPAGRPVRLHCWPGDHRLEEAARVVELVRAARAAGQRSIAILARSRHHLDRILPALRAARLPYQAVEFEGLGTRSVVRDLRALLSLLVTPAEAFSWLAVLRGPGCGLSLAELACLVAPSGAGLPEALDDPAALGTLGEPTAARVRNLRAAWRLAWQQRGRRSLRRRLEGLWLALGGPAWAPHAVLDARDFLDLVEQLEEGGDLPHAARLDERLAGLRARAAPGGDGLEVMTIHRAKGLEFDCVILPGMGRAPRGRGQRLLLFEERLADGRLLIAPVRSRRTSGNDPIYEFLMKRDRARERHELGRLLYVAATRARSELHLLGHLEPRAEKRFEPHSGSLLEALDDGTVARFRAVLEDVEPHVRGQVLRHVSQPAPRRLPLAWQPPVIPAPAGQTLAAERTASGGAGRLAPRADARVARARGIVLHRLMALQARRVREEGDVALGSEHLRGLAPVVRAALVGEGLSVAQAARETGELLVTLGRVHDDARGRWLLADHPESACELALEGWIDGVWWRTRVDRTFVENGVRWVIDYKTGELGAEGGAEEPRNHGPRRADVRGDGGAGAREGGASAVARDEVVARHREQLAVYRRLFSAQRPDQPVKTALYALRPPGWVLVE